MTSKNDRRDIIPSSSSSDTTPLLIGEEVEINEESKNKDGDYGSCSILVQHSQRKSNISSCWAFYHAEFPQMFVQIIMQDGPFLFLRMALVIKYEMISELHIFFMCKNALICILLVYRFVILMNEKKTTRI